MRAAKTEYKWTDEGSECSFRHHRNRLLEADVERRVLRGGTVLTIVRITVTKVF